MDEIYIRERDIESIAGNGAFIQIGRVIYHTGEGIISEVPGMLCVSVYAVCVDADSASFIMSHFTFEPKNGDL